MRAFSSLSEQEILALAISLEEEDARIYDDFADGLKNDFPATSELLKEMRAEEDGHRHRLIELHRQKFGEHIPLIRRQDVKGFVQRRPIWLARPLRIDAVRKQIELMELETKQVYEKAIQQTTDAGIRQLLGDLAEEERRHSRLAEELETTQRESGALDEEEATRHRMFVSASHSARFGGADGRLRLDARSTVRRRLRHPKHVEDLSGRIGGGSGSWHQHGLCRSAVR